MSDVEKLHRIIYEGTAEAKQLFDNCQVRYLIDLRPDLITSNDAEAAVQALSNLDYVGFAENFAHVCWKLSEVTGREIALHSLHRMSVAKLDEIVDLRDRAVLDFYRGAVRWDAFLYTAARAQAGRDRCR